MQKRIKFGIDLANKLSLKDAFYKFMMCFWQNFDIYINQVDKGEKSLKHESIEITQVYVFNLKLYRYMCLILN